MKRITVFTTLILCGVLLFGTSNVFAKKKMKKQAMMMAAEDMKWEEMKGGPPGIMVAKLWGDMQKGAYGTVVKLPPNMKNPLHTHSNDVKMVIISGSFIAGPEGGPEKTYGPGSYLMVPGRLRHISGTGDQGCTAFQESSGKMDMKPVEMAKEKK